MNFDLIRDFEKVVVLDTNIPMDDYKSILKFPNTLVVLPLITVRELDGLKNSRDGGTRSQVRKASRLLDELTEQFAEDFPDDDIMPLETEGSYFVTEAGYYYEYDALDPSEPDSKIISTAIAYARELPETNVTLYSNDVDVRVEARGVAKEHGLRNLKATEYKSKNTGLKDIHTGVENLFFSSETINKTRDKGRLSMELPYVNGEHVFMIDEVNPDHILLAQYDAIHKQLLPLPDYKKGPAIWGSGENAVRPKDARQSFLIHDMMNKDKEILFVLSRLAGAGKNFLTTACALNLLNQGEYDRFLVVKPMVEVDGESTGFLPGSKEEKLGPWFDSFKDTMHELTFDGQYDLGDDMDGKIELDIITHMRGRSIPRTIIVIDEAQNLSELAIKTLLTRAGQDTKIILSGDLSQIDNLRLDSENNGLRVWADRARHPEHGYEKSTYILLDSNFRSPLSAWASGFYE